MLRRIAMFAGLLTMTGTAGVLVSAPAYAVDHVICVGSPVGPCDEHASTIQLAIAQALVTGQTNTIFVGPGTYTDGPYEIDGSSGPGITFKGSGQGVTILALAASGAADTYVVAHEAGVQDLTIAMAGVSSSNDTGLSLESAWADHVAISGANTFAATGLHTTGASAVSHATIALTSAPGTGNVGLFGEGGASVTDSSITATRAVNHSGSTTDTLSRVVLAGQTGVRTDSGDVAVEDALIDLGSADDARGLLVSNLNNSVLPKSISANHVTVVGGGAGSIGAAAHALSPGGVQQSTIQLHNSIIDGPATSLDVQAENDGSLGADSTATISTAYSDWSTSNVYSGTGGAATLVSGAGHLDVDPAFRNPAGGDYRLGASSPLIDKGAPGTSAPTVDLDDGPRILDGNGDGVAVRDMGAYEAPAKSVVPVTATPDATAPDTTITAHPRKHTAKRRATFRFTASEAPATFQCRMDKRAWGPCTSPTSSRVTRGWHVFKVRAIDTSGNLDPTAARFRFHRV